MKKTEVRKPRTPKAPKCTWRLLVLCVIVLFLGIAFRDIVARLIGTNWYTFAMIIATALGAIAVGGICTGKGPVEWVISLFPEKDEEFENPYEFEPEQVEAPVVHKVPMIDDLEVPDGDWELRKGKLAPKEHLSSLVRNGKVKIPDGYILDGNCVRPKNLRDKINLGEIAIPAGWKLAEDGESLIKE